MKVSWTVAGFKTLLKLMAFLSEYLGEEKAIEFQQELIQFATNKLSTNPERNPPCNYPKLQAAGYRCLKFKKHYVIVYKEESNVVQIIGVGSSKQNPDFFNNLIN